MQWVRENVPQRALLKHLANLKIALNQKIHLQIIKKGVFFIKIFLFLNKFIVQYDTIKYGIAFLGFMYYEKIIIFTFRSSYFKY